jgi:hypothetical protein
MPGNDSAPPYAYLLGLITAKGTIYPTSKKIAIEFPHANNHVNGIATCPECGALATKSRGGVGLTCRGCGVEVDDHLRVRYEQRASTLKSISEGIIPYVTAGNSIQSTILGNKSVSVMVLDFKDNAELFAKILGDFPVELNYWTFRIPSKMWRGSDAERLAYMSGIFDATGYANVGNWIPRMGKNGQERMRVYIQIVRNWHLTCDIDQFLRNSLSCPVQTIDWGHPNIRDSKLEDYRTGKASSGGREHQIKVYPEYLPPLSPLLSHKKQLLGDLLAHNLRCEFPQEYGWFPPTPIKDNQRKPAHPGESDVRLPVELQKHFDASWQISLALGTKDLVEYASKASSFEAFALTGDLKCAEAAGPLRARLNQLSQYLHQGLPAARKIAEPTASPARQRAYLEKDTYPVLIKLLEKELVARKQSKPIVLDTSARNLNSSIQHLSKGQLAHIDVMDSWSIRPDIIAFTDSAAEPILVEAKIEPLSLAHLGQILAYCAVAAPKRAILVSTEPVSDALRRTILRYPGILDYGSGSAVEIAHLDGQSINYLRF